MKKQAWIYMNLILVVICMSGVFLYGCAGFSVKGSREYEGSECSGSNMMQIDAKKDSGRHISSLDDAFDYMRRSGFWSNYSKGILPQMAEDELEYAKKILESFHDGFIVVDKDRMEVIRFDRYGVELVSFDMACAKNYGTKHKRSDSRTPEGFFSVRKVHDSTDWHYVSDDGVRSNKKGEFGPRFIRLNVPGTTQIGIHGTCVPSSIGGRRSHGCIRLRNEDIMKLVTLVDSGMPVIIIPGIKDMLVNREEGCETPTVGTVPGRRRLSLDNPGFYMMQVDSDDGSEA